MTRNQQKAMFAKLRLFDINNRLQTNKQMIQSTQEELSMRKKAGIDFKGRAFETNKELQTKVVKLKERRLVLQSKKRKLQG